MIFSNLFHRKKNKESETGSFSQYDQSEYAKLETKNIVKELNLSDAAQAKKYVVDLCKQMIQAIMTQKITIIITKTLAGKAQLYRQDRLPVTALM